MADNLESTTTADPTSTQPLWKRAIRAGYPVGMAAVALSAMGQADMVAAVDSASLVVVAESLATTAFPEGYGKQRSKLAGVLWVGVAAGAVEACRHLATTGSPYHAVGAAILAGYAALSTYQHYGKREKAEALDSVVSGESQALELAAETTTPRRRRLR